MVERKWTPGPWVATTYKAGEFDVTARIDNSSWSGTLCSRSPWGRNAGQSKANAHLIAAAPDMYDVLEAMAELRNNTSPFGGELQEDRIEMAFDAARAALAKARGES